MTTLTEALLLAIALAFVVGVVPAIRWLLRDHKGNASPFRDYFGSEYDRDLLQQSALSETGEWLADDDSRLPSFRPRYLEGRERN